MKILFHSNQLSLRGTEVALYDYAHYNEEILHNSSLIAIKRSGQHHPLAVKKFHTRFNVIYYDSLNELQKCADENKRQGNKCECICRGTDIRTGDICQSR